VPSTRWSCVWKRFFLSFLSRCPSALGSLFPLIAVTINNHDDIKKVLIRRVIRWLKGTVSAEEPPATSFCHQAERGGGGAVPRWHHTFISPHTHLIPGMSSMLVSPVQLMSRNWERERKRKKIIKKRREQFTRRFVRANMTLGHVTSGRTKPAHLTIVNILGSKCADFFPPRFSNDTEVGRSREAIHVWGFAGGNRTSSSCLMIWIPPPTAV